MKEKDLTLQIKEIRRQQTKIESQIAKQEEDGIYDNSLYEKLDELDKEAEDIQAELDKLENYAN